MLNPTGNWLPYIPYDRDVQVSKSQDFEACASYSAVHIAEMLIKFNTGQFWEFSERALAKLSDTQPWGNTLDNVVNALKQTGLLLARDWPELTYSDKYENIDWATYYQQIPQSVLVKASPFVINSYRKLTAGEVDAALKAGPLWTIIKTSGGQLHAVAQINKTQYYDSYEIRVKNFQDGGAITSQYQLLLTPKIMTNAQLVNNKGEWGFFVPATKEDTLIDKALNFGYPLATLENGTKVDWPNVKADITV